MSDQNEIQRREDAPITKVRHLLEAKRNDLAMALPKHLTVDRLLRVTLTAVNKTPKLLDCTRESLLACVMDCASLGLEPDNTLGRAYIIPYGNKATLVIGYKGLVDLAYRSGMVDSLDAFAVHSNDSFKLTLGLNPDIQHEPKLSDRGEMSGVYAVARLKGSSLPKFVYMAREEVESIRKRSRAGDSGPWKTDYEEMAKKTAIRRLSKLLPLSVEFADALAKDQEFDLGHEKQPEAKRPLFSRPPTVDVAPTALPANAEERKEASQAGDGNKTRRMNALCQKTGIDFGQALQWCGELGFATFEDMDNDTLNAAEQHPEAWAKQVKGA